MPMDPETIHLYSRHLMAICFLIAAGASAISKKPGYAIFYTLAVAETYFRLRYPLHDKLRDMLLGVAFQREGQRAFQAELMTIFAGLTILLAIALLFLFRKASTGKKLMLWGTLGVLSMLATEMISHHSIDAIIYKIDGPIVRSAGFYALCSLICAAGALMERSSAQRRR